MTEGPLERRRDLRIKGNFPLRIGTEEYDLVAETKDISCSGAYCFVEKFIKTMTRLSINLNLPIKNKDSETKLHVHCQGIVVRTEKVADFGYNIAIFFNDISEADKHKITQYINQAFEAS